MLACFTQLVENEGKLENPVITIVAVTISSETQYLSVLGRSKYQMANQLQLLKSLTKCGILVCGSIFSAMLLVDLSTSKP